ncbi:MAG: hypothetical protein ACUVR2_12895 [Anaerolineae bacterium]
MKEAFSIAQLPNVPAVYAMYGGQGRGLYVAYVGVADSLKRRIIQHLVSRDSSVAAGTSAVGLNPDYVTEIRWWEHPEFTERHVLEAAELVAFDVLNPALRSRGNIQEQAKRLYANEEFSQKMRLLFQNEPTGRLLVSTLQDALEKIAMLEKRIDALESELVQIRSVLYKG